MTKTTTNTATNTIDDFLEYMTVERNASKNTLRAYRRDLLDLEGYLGDLVSATHSQLRSWLGYLEMTGNSPSTIGRKLACVRSFFKHCKREGWATDNPAADLDFPRRDKRLPRVLSVEEVQDCMRHAKSLRDRAIVETLYGGGLRIGELTKLNVEDFQDGTVKVFGKGGVERICPLGPVATLAIDAYLGERTTGPLFIGRQGRLGERTVRKIVSRLGTNPHAFRHSYATHMLDAGADIRQLQELLGHRSITSTEIYAHVSSARKKAAHEAFHPRGAI